MKALIVAGGIPPSKKLLRKHADAGLVIAADRGADAIHKCGMVADIIIGDFDSASPKTINQVNEKTKIIRLSVEKDETDCMAALKTAFENGADSAVLLGALGDRTDHAYANMMLLQYAKEHGVRLVLEDEYCEITLASGKTEISARAGQTISILPWMGSATVSAPSGAFYYPLQKLHMPADNPVGISNIININRAEIFIEGTVLLFKINKMR